METAEDFRLFVVGRQRSLLRTAWLLTDWSTAEDLVQTALVSGLTTGASPSTCCPA
jgi:hypothetical protein